MVRGKPSNKKPWAQSGCAMRSLTRWMMMSSLTKDPESITALACRPSGVPALTAARSMSPVEVCGMPYRWQMKPPFRRRGRPTESVSWKSSKVVAYQAAGCALRPGCGAAVEDSMGAAVGSVAGRGECRVIGHLSVCAGHRSAARRCAACRYARCSVWAARCALRCAPMAARSLRHLTDDATPDSEQKAAHPFQVFGRVHARAGGGCGQVHGDAVAMPERPQLFQRLDGFGRRGRELRQLPQKA